MIVASALPTETVAKLADVEGAVAVHYRLPQQNWSLRMERADLDTSRKVAFKRMQDQIADAIRERIIIGEYERGKRLKQLELAAAFGVSVTPVREAFGILEAEGYLMGSSHRGAVVPKIHRDQAREIRDLRLILEVELLSQAMERLDEPTIAAALRVHEACARAIEAADWIEVRRLNYRFHFIFYETAERQQTLAFVRVLWAKYPFHDLDAIDQRQSRMQAEHQDFLDRITAHDKAGAIEALKDHINKGWREFSSTG